MSSFDVELDVRADEDSAFVPSDLVPDARVGDSVSVRSAHLDDVRTGVVAEVLDDDTRGRFHRITFE